MAGDVLWQAVAAAIGYLLGSVPFGLVLTRFVGAGDLRRIGSGNIGATNVLRTGRKGLAALTLVLDGAKGVVAVVALAPVGEGAALTAGVAAVLGHDFPVWLAFRGGKGVATTLGVLLAVAWPAGVAACLTWLVVAAVMRYSSLAALAGLGAAPFYILWLAPSAQRGPMAATAGVLAVLAFVRHHTNIRRLLRGDEPRIGSKATPSA